MTQILFITFLSIMIGLSAGYLFFRSLRHHWQKLPTKRFRHR